MLSSVEIWIASPARMATTDSPFTENSTQPDEHMAALFESNFESPGSCLGLVGASLRSVTRAVGTVRVWLIHHISYSKRGMKRIGKLIHRSNKIPLLPCPPPTQRFRYEHCPHRSARALCSASHQAPPFLFFLLHIHCWRRSLQQWTVLAEPASTRGVDTISDWASEFLCKRLSSTNLFTRKKCRHSACRNVRVITRVWTRKI